jgi:hypothetical protein
MLTLPVMAVAADDPSTFSQKKRTILMSEDYDGREESFHDRYEEPESSSILKSLRERLTVESYRYGTHEKRKKLKIRVRIYDFSPNHDGVRHMLEMRPQIGSEPGLTFIYHF